MFDFEHQIRQWRRGISIRLPIHSDAVAELEDHLREAVQRHVQNGMTQEAAWTKAMEELGSPDSIMIEFNKLPGYAVYRWWPARIVMGTYFIVALLASSFIVSRLLKGKIDTLLALHVLTITLGYTAVFSISAIAAWSVLSRTFRGWSDTETEVLSRTTWYITVSALVLTMLGMALGGFWVYSQTGQYWAWNPKEIGGVTLVAWNALVLVLLNRRKNERIGMVLGLMGSALVTLCWFGPIFAASGALHGQRGSDIPIRVAVIEVASLLALLSLVCLPAGHVRYRR